MKKLTAGIFTVLMGLVTVNAAEAAVASKGYVDAKVGDATADITALEATVGANKTAAENAIAAAKKASEDALAAYKETNDTAVAKNAEDIAANAQSITNVSNAVAAEKTAREQADTALETAYKAADTALDARLVEVEKFSGTGEGSVAAQIAGALDSAKDYTDAEVKELADGAVATNTANISAMDTAYKTADTTLQGNIDALSDTVTAMDGAYKAADAQTLTDAKTYAKEYADGLDSAQKTAFENADKAINDKIGTVAEGKTVVEMIADAQQAATFDPTEIKADIKANADAIDVIEASDYATSGITAAKVSAYDEYNATITANTAAAAAAQATADAAIPAPEGDCANPTNKCVLTYNNSAYTWEVIERATGETVE